MVDENMNDVGAYRKGNHQAEVDRLASQLTSAETEVAELKAKLASRRLFAVVTVAVILVALVFSAAAVYTSIIPAAHIAGASDRDVDFHGMPAFVIFTILAWIGVGLLIWRYKK